MMSELQNMDPASPLELSTSIDLIIKAVKLITPQYAKSAEELANMIRKQSTLLRDLYLLFTTFGDLKFNDEEKCKEWARNYIANADSLMGKMHMDYVYGTKKIEHLLGGKLKELFTSDKQRLDNVKHIFGAIFDLKNEVYKRHLQKIHEPLNDISLEISDNNFDHKKFDKTQKFVKNNIKEIKQLTKKLTELQIAFDKATLK